MVITIEIEHVITDIYSRLKKPSLPIEKEPLNVLKIMVGILKDTLQNLMYR